MKEAFKSIALKFGTWKKLSIMRVEMDFKTMDDLINELIEYRGY